MDGLIDQSWYGGGERRNTDKVLHENVDCRIVMTEQHALAIDVGGSVIVRDTLVWHQMAERIEQVKAYVKNRSECGRASERALAHRVMEMLEAR